eukprot:2703472-Amphidinium_carterae.1
MRAGPPARLGMQERSISNAVQCVAITIVFSVSEPLNILIFTMRTCCKEPSRCPLAAALAEGPLPTSSDRTSSVPSNASIACCEKAIERVLRDLAAPCVTSYTMPWIFQPLRPFSLGHQLEHSHSLPDAERRSGLQLSSPCNHLAYGICNR